MCTPAPARAVTPTVTCGMPAASAQSRPAISAASLTTRSGRHDSTSARTAGRAALVTNPANQRPMT